MFGKVGSRTKEKTSRYTAGALGTTFVAILVIAGLPWALAGGGAGRSSGITEECNEAVCSVSMSGSAFIPDTMKIRPGATVVWTSEEKMPHTVTSGNFRDNAGPLFDSGSSSPIMQDEKFEHKFDTTGSFEYFCQIHPRMVGSIVVAGEPVAEPTNVQFMMIIAAGVFGTFALVAGIRLRK